MSNTETRPAAETTTPATAPAWTYEIIGVRYHLDGDACRALGEGSPAKGADLYEKAMDSLTETAVVNVWPESVAASRGTAAVVFVSPSGDDYEVTATLRHLGAWEAFDGEDAGIPSDLLRAAADDLTVLCNKAWEKACEGA